MRDWPHPDDDEPLSRGERAFAAIIVVLTIIGVGLTLRQIVHWIV